MTLKRLLLLALVGVAIVLAIAATGCGGGDGDASAGEGASGGGSASAGTGGETSPAYEKVLRGLDNAAQSDSTYNALRRSKNFEPAEKAVIDSFCVFAWQIGVNKEEEKLAKHPYIVGRITQYAEYNLTDSAAIEVAMDKLRTIIDLESLDAELVKSYSKACER